MKLSMPALLVAFMFLFIDAKAQQPHFIYIQTENKQPFYVKMHKTIYSSTVSGYVIISKLPDSTYNFTIGFPKNEWEQQNFTCVINKKDEGYVLKNFGDKGWRLFNLETMEVIMPNTPADEKNIVKEERTDSFSNMLSAVVNDPGIKQKAIVRPDTLQTNDTAMQTIAKSTVIKILQKTNNDGIELVYLDIENNDNDTIRLFIPVDKTLVTIEPKDTEKIVIDTVKKEPVVEKKNPVAEVQNSNVVNSAGTTSKKIAVKAMPETKPDSVTLEANPVGKIIPDENKEKTIASVNNNGCTNFATDEDFLKLRKKMAAADSDDDMLSIAKKFFKSKCFTTEQIKNLGFLFLKDEGKYKFFDIAYSFVSDPVNFNSLQSQLTEADYIDRFKVMVKH